MTNFILFALAAGSVTLGVMVLSKDRAECWVPANASVADVASFLTNQEIETQRAIIDEAIRQLEEKHPSEADPNPPVSL
jgi:hypothetical protein